MSNTKRMITESALTFVMASKRKTLCVDQKVALIRAIEKGEKKSDVGRRFGFSPSTITTIWKNKEKILQAETEGSSCKKIRKPKFEDLDQAMLTWFHKKRCNNVPISGPILKIKAEHFAQQLGIIDFKASEGWLGKFKQRHNITYGKLSGGSLNVDLNVTNSWLIKVSPKSNEKYTPDDIFNADETGIFYKMTPGKTLKFKGEKCVEDKLSKVQLKKDKEEEQPDEVVIPSIQQVLDAAKLLEKYLLFHEDDPKLSQNMGQIHKKLQKKYWQSKQVQTKMTDCFK